MKIASAGANTLEREAPSPRAVGAGARTVSAPYKQVREEYWFPISRRNQDLHIRFFQLLYAWKEDSKFTSSVAQMILHPNYLQIIALGTPAVPLLLEELLREPDFLFHALSAITGVNPIQSEHYGDTTAMTADWIEWGRGEGLVASARHPRRN